MAFQENLKSISLVAGEDLQENQYHLVSVNIEGEIVLSGVGDVSVGVLQNDPEETHVGTVGVYGVTKIVAGEAFDAGTRLEADVDGKGVATTTGSVIGIALTSSSDDGEIISMLITHEG